MVRVTTSLMLVGALTSCRIFSPRVVDSVFVTAAHGQCSVRHIRDLKDFKDAIGEPGDTMPCTSVAEYLKDDMKRPAGEVVGVLLDDDADADDVRLIADLKAAGFRVSTVGPIRRVVYPSGNPGS